MCTCTSRDPYRCAYNAMIDPFMDDEHSPVEMAFWREDVDDEGGPCECRCHNKWLPRKGEE